MKVLEREKVVHTRLMAKNIMMGTNHVKIGGFSMVRLVKDGLCDINKGEPEYYITVTSHPN